MINYKTDVEFHYDVLELLARRLRPQLYVELGIAAAKCIERVAPFCQRAIGVDVEKPDPIAGYDFFLMSTEEFLTDVLPGLGPVDLAFIDADHKYEASLRDFELLLPKMSQDGLVLLHDTYPESPYWLAGDQCSDAYRTAEAIRRGSRDLGIEIVTLPTPPGISIVRRCDQQIAWLPDEDTARCK